MLPDTLVFLDKTPEKRITPGASVPKSGPHIKNDIAEANPAKISTLKNPAKRLFRRHSRQKGTICRTDGKAQMKQGRRGIIAGAAVFP